MIHYITVGVALERPPATHEYRKYAIYGGTHSDAELVALQMAACTSVMPVSIERERGTLGSDCDRAGCRVSVQEPHGAMGCRCWPEDADAFDFMEGDTFERWLVDEHCPYHGGPERECPPGVHSCFDFCPGGCLNDDDGGPAAEPDRASTTEPPPASSQCAAGHAWHSGLGCHCKPVKGGSAPRWNWLHRWVRRSGKSRP